MIPIFRSPNINQKCHTIHWKYHNAKNQSTIKEQTITDVTRGKTRLPLCPGYFDIGFRGGGGKSTILVPVTSNSPTYWSKTLQKPSVLAIFSEFAPFAYVALQVFGLLCEVCLPHKRISKLVVGFFPLTTRPLNEPHTTRQHRRGWLT